MASSSLIVPLTFWVNLPTAPVTTVAYKEGHIVTGLEDGHIWIYRCTIDERGTPQLQHKILCFGHKSSITALAIIEGQTDGCAGNDYVLISASKDGDVNKWCLLDGRCLTSISKSFCGIIKSLKPLAEYSQPAKFLLCSGFSNEITILNCTTLELVRIWGGHNDWVTCTPFYDSDARQIRLLTSNFNGILKIWTFDESNHINKEYDNVGLLDAQGDKILELTSNPYDIGVILAITKSYAIIFTIRRGKMVNFQRIRNSKEGIYWASGAFLSKNRVLLWNQMGSAYLYSIPSYTEKKIAAENAHLHIKPSLIRRSSLPNLQKSNVEKLPNSAQLRPQLLETVCSDDEDNTGLAITTVFTLSSIDGKTSNWYLITFRNQINGTSFAFKSLSPITQESGICENYHVREQKWPPETYLSDIWQLNHKNDNITVTTMAYDIYLAIGYENGEIHLVPLSKALTKSAEIQNSTSIPNSIRKLEGHIGKVTCLYTPNSQIFGNKYLLSGGEDCSVRIWDLEGKKLASFKFHSQCVTHFFEPPSDECQRIKRCVISVAKDNSLAIISLEELNCLYVFGGYSYPLDKIQWRTSEGFIILFYNDDTAHIWQTQTFELFQKVTGSAARDMLKDESWRTSSVKQQEVVINKTLTSFTDNSENDGKTFLQIFAINVKQLINDIYHYHVSQFGSKPNCTRVIEDFDEKPSTMSKIFSWTTGGALQSSSVTSTSPSIEPETKAIDASTVQVLVSNLMTWGIDSSLDKLCAEKLGLKKSSDRITFGLRGANGNMAFAVPSPNDSAAVWKISQTMTASLLLSIVGLTRSFLSMKGLEKYTSEIITHYGSLLPELVGKDYYHSSLAFHAKYFQDPLEDIRISARSLFSSALNNMPPSELTSIIDYWKQFSVASPDIYTNQYMARSTILLGMIGSDYPRYLSQTVARNIALSLVLLLHDSSKLSHRLAALEFYILNFLTFLLIHFDAVAVLKTLFTFAIETDTNAASIRAMAQKAIFQISAANTPLCVSTLTHDTNDSKKPTEKSGFLKLISLFIRKRPLLLHANLSGLVEAVVKSLDPNIPKMRDTVLQTTTSVLHDLVKTFPSVTFHGGLQKLAVGTLEGASIIYDLRTATRLHILEGHTKSVTAISFSGDGRLIVSCSLEEGTVRVWNANPGFLGMIANGTSRKTPLSSSIRPSKTFGFNLGDDARLSVASILESVYFDWVADRTTVIQYKIELTHQVYANKFLVSVGLNRTFNNKL
ncbi:WD40 repeat-like protein [Rhizophagus clarus]|uniref:WD40 repeat-like protein n=1 Tax=Rhizophagus clarus TaxID=94130 RepID=A0A8H3L1T7_9GLOM|nr:WD40 repeat-like protein [Rhizophagus clarus]